MENTAIVTCLHGDELFGLEILDSLASKMPVFIGNPLAIKKKVRYVDSDMNRVFPGKEDGNYEEKRALHLLEKLKKFKYVIDIHSSSGDIELFGIITKPSFSKLQLAKKLHLKKVVVMPEEFAKGKSLIDNLNCAISLEIGPHEKKENVDEVLKAINSCSDEIENNVEVFEIFDRIEGENNPVFHMHNFGKVKTGDLIAEGAKKYYAEFDFIPVFVGEKAYNKTLCLAARKTDLPICALSS